jgi:AraC-like DNA-binding protein
MTSPAIHMVALPSWLKAARLCDISLEPVLRDNQVELNADDPLKTVVSTEVMMRAMAACTAAATERGIAHFPFVLGSTFAFDFLSDIEVFLASSPDLRAALQVLDWLPRVIDPHLSATLVEAGDMARIELAHHGLPPGFERYAHLACEVTFAGLLRYLRMLQGDAFAIRAIHWRQGAPEARDGGLRPDHQAHFGAPMDFEQGRDAMLFDRAWLDRPRAHVVPGLHEATRLRVERQLHALAPAAGLHGVAARVEQLLSASPELLGQPLGDIASRLNLHERTLQRRLRAKGMAYSDLQDRVRCRLAKAWLRQSPMPIEEISERLGFADRRGFVRAFGRWANMSPTAYRRTSGL